jgi:hypothetical protein
MPKDLPRYLIYLFFLSFTFFVSKPATYVSKPATYVSKPATCVSKPET